jgi:hypothetical protein
MTERIAADYFPRVARKAESFGHACILIIRDVPTSMPAGTLFQKTAGFVGMMRGIRVAFVNPYPELQDDLEFSMTVSVNRGGDYRLFDNEAAAAAWLLSG